MKRTVLQAAALLIACAFISYSCVKSWTSPKNMTEDERFIEFRDDNIRLLQEIKQDLKGKPRVDNAEKMMEALSPKVSSSMAAFVKKYDPILKELLEKYEKPSKKDLADFYSRSPVILPTTNPVSTESFYACREGYNRCIGNALSDATQCFFGCVGIAALTASWGFPVCYGFCVYRQYSDNEVCWEKFCLDKVKQPEN